ncbi:hypothetical protein [Maribacter sp.]|uniref:hypothetical protein n=1 Tax=Maribacter sp. TaxID=1897614 RepID=UPI0032970F08
MRLEKATTDSLYLPLNDYVISKKPGLYKIDKAENYSKITYGYSKNQISQMQIEGVIFNINRD